MLRLFAGLIAQYIEKEHLVNQLREANAALITHSYTDALTGLPNRRAIFDNLSTLFSLARHLDIHVIIAFIDLDNFKVINDQLGHEAGDRFLIDVGRRLAQERGKDDIVGRLGGDEFLIASPGGLLSQPHGVNRIALQNTLNSRLCGEYNLGACRIDYPGASVGVIEINPHIIDPDGALRYADEVIYQVKNSKEKKIFSRLD
ncbi:GGDEF domain-containing protein [Vagococcus sp. WN89Y]|uniref:GGDEF domain-containing protein n=1 Tax=Vagococcus sp. WN89Y TaxID=3457258 RepID=UPI003FCDD476